MISHSEVKLNLFLISCPPPTTPSLSSISISVHNENNILLVLMKYSLCLECCFLCLRLKPVYSNDSHSYIPTLNSMICQSKSSQMLSNQQILSFWSLLKQFQEFKYFVIVCFLTNSQLELLKIVEGT